MRIKKRRVGSIATRAASAVLAAGVQASPPELPLATPAVLAARKPEDHHLPEQEAEPPLTAPQGMAQAPVAVTVPIAVYVHTEPQSHSQPAPQVWTPPNITPLLTEAKATASGGSFGD